MFSRDQVWISYYRCLSIALVLWLCHSTAVNASFWCGKRSSYPLPLTKAVSLHWTASSKKLSRNVQQIRLLLRGVIISLSSQNKTLLSWRKNQAALNREMRLGHILSVSHMQYGYDSAKLTTTFIHSSGGCTDSCRHWSWKMCQVLYHSGGRYSEYLLSSTMLEWVLTHWPI